MDPSQLNANSKYSEKSTLTEGRLVYLNPVNLKEEISKIIAGLAYNPRQIHAGSEALGDSNMINWATQQKIISVLDSVFEELSLDLFGEVQRDFKRKGQEYIRNHSETEEVKADAPMHEDKLGEIGGNTASLICSCPFCRKQIALQSSKQSNSSVEDWEQSILIEDLLANAPTNVTGGISNMETDMESGAEALDIEYMRKCPTQQKIVAVLRNVVEEFSLGLLGKVQQDFKRKGQEYMRNHSEKAKVQADAPLKEDRFDEIGRNAAIRMCTCPTSRKQMPLQSSKQPNSNVNDRGQPTSTEDLLIHLKPANAEQDIPKIMADMVYNPLQTRAGSKKAKVQADAPMKEDRFGEIGRNAAIRMCTCPICRKQMAVRSSRQPNSNVNDWDQTISTDDLRINLKQANAEEDIPKIMANMASNPFQTHAGSKKANVQADAPMKGDRFAEIGGTATNWMCTCPHYRKQTSIPSEFVPYVHDFKPRMESWRRSTCPSPKMWVCRNREPANAEVPSASAADETSMRNMGHSEATASGPIGMFSEPREKLVITSSTKKAAPATNSDRAESTGIEHSSVVPQLPDATPTSVPLGKWFNASVPNLLAYPLSPTHTLMTMKSITCFVWSRLPGFQASFEPTPATSSETLSVDSPSRPLGDLQKPIYWPGSICGQISRRSGKTCIALPSLMTLATAPDIEEDIKTPMENNLSDEIDE